MSRRDSRIQIEVRQNDALQEFETFKKKFLFANKQITKQNSNLSLKIEELNAHISTLYVENLRLRASEIALASQLKKERDRSQRIMADAEAATLRLLEQLGIIRESYQIRTPEQSTTPDSPPSPPPPRAKRPARSPSAMRLAQQPNIPDILEDPEPDESPANDHRQCNGSDVSKGQFGRNAFVTKAKPRNSSSRLPVPSRVSSPPPVDAELVSEETHGKKKLTRRPSGLMTLNGHRLRPPTPTFGAPVDLADLGDSDEDGEEFTRALCTESERESGTGKESGAEEVKRKRKERSTKAGEDEEDAACTSDKKEKKRAKDKDGLHVNRLKDVTNSPRRKRRSGSVTDSASEVEKYPATKDASQAVQITSPLATHSIIPDSYLPTPLPSSANSTPAPHLISLPTSDCESINPGGRERRTRKSVNYAEPKLNTKMRKPDSIPPPGARPSISSNEVPPKPTTRRRSLETTESTSTGSSEPLNEELDSSPTDPDPPVRTSRLASAVAKRKIQLHEDLVTDDRSDEETGDIYYDDGDEADAEFAPSSKRNWSNVGVSRRRSSTAGSAAIITLEASEKRRRSAFA